MVTVVKTLVIGCQPRYSKELDYGLDKLGIKMYSKPRYFTTNVFGKVVCRYYVEVQYSNTEDEERLLNWLNDEFKHEVIVRY